MADFDQICTIFCHDFNYIRLTFLNTNNSLCLLYNMSTSQNSKKDTFLNSRAIKRISFYQPEVTCSKSTMKTSEQCVRFVQS